VSRAKRSLGQNFLVDDAYIARIVDGAGVRPDDTVVEIGPGRGALTHRLRSRAARFIAIEKDDALAEVHRAAFADDPTSELVHGDALTVMPADLPFPGPYRIVANLPYNMAGRITLHLLEQWGSDAAAMTLMFQAEVANRIVAQPGTKPYGSLSVQIQAFCQGWRLFTVPGGAFRPRPKVLSAVVRLERRPEPLFVSGGVERAWFRTVVRAGFQSRRKTLVNSLKLAPALPSDNATLEAALEAAGLPVSVRGDSVDPEGFVRLAAALQSTREGDAD